jgi:SAM-dependent methyltransferase
MQPRPVFLLLLSLGAALGASGPLGIPAARAATSPVVQRPSQSPDVHFVPTPSEVVDAMLGLAGVTSTDVIYDLGSGDGRIVITAAQRYGAHGVGIELDPDLIKQANERARKAGVADKVRFIQADFFKADLSEATVVTLYLLQSINLRLRPKLLRELRAGSRIVSHRFDMGDWKPDQTLTVRRAQVFLWKVPDK